MIVQAEGLASLRSHKHSLQQLLQVVQLLTWKSDTGAPAANVWDEKDKLHLSELQILTKEVSSACLDSQASIASDGTGARVTAVAFCHSLAEMADARHHVAGISDTDQELEKPAFAHAANGGLLLLRMLGTLLKEDATMQLSVPFKGSDVHRRKIRIWQALSVLARLSKRDTTALQIDDVLSQLCLPELASVKQYQETGATWIGS
jgi:hypothetical protein